MLEHDHKTTIAKSLRMFLIRDFAILDQLCAIRAREMLAAIGEDIIPVTKFVRGHEAYVGLF